MEKKSLIERVEVIKMPVRIAILAGTLILLIGVFVFWGYMPKTEQIKTTQKSIEDLNGKLNQARVQRKKLPKTREEKKNVDLQFAEALKMLPNNMEIPELLTKITELGVNANLDISTFRPQNNRKKGFYEEIPISLRIKGTYHDVAVFFEKVGKMERIMNIQNVTMKPEKERSTILNVTCDAITYTFVKGK
jgi:type IV pilus assembly protein PilO